MNRKITSRPCMILLAVLSIQTVYAANPLPFAHATGQSQGISPHALTQLTAEVDGYIRDEKIVGAELLVIKNRKTVLHKGLGWHDRDKGIPMTINTI